ncbi:MAG: DUF411 domain-containing protein [Rhodoferax sp.]|nr:DUF411 domain-containing protein [Rhodoferax sp.]
MQRRRLVSSLAAALGAAALSPTLSAQSARPRVEVWKDPNCGCCQDWVRHLQANGFEVRVHDSGNAAARARLGVAERWGSCHTASVGGYAIEGHVPAGDIHRLLKERPQAIGLSVPGMPVGSPGMDAPAYGGRQDPFDVLLLQHGGQARVFRSYHKG